MSSWRKNQEVWLSWPDSDYEAHGFYQREANGEHLVSFARNGSGGVWWVRAEQIHTMPRKLRGDR